MLLLSSLSTKEFMLLACIREILKKHGLGDEFPVGEDLVIAIREMLNLNEVQYGNQPEDQWF
jgi:hypothetical protein